MPTPTKGPRLGGGPAHERLMLANLATSLFEHGRITTTEAKAKRLRPLAERLITFAKRGDLHARRHVLTVVRDQGVVHRLFTEIGPAFADRPGGYTRIVKTVPRKGDNAPMAVIELVEALTLGQEAVGEAERARGTRFSRRRALSGRTRESAEELATESPTAAAVLERADEATADETDASGPAHVWSDSDDTERSEVADPGAVADEDSVADEDRVADEDSVADEDRVTDAENAAGAASGARERGSAAAEGDSDAQHAEGDSDEPKADGS